MFRSVSLLITLISIRPKTIDCKIYGIPDQFLYPSKIGTIVRNYLSICWLLQLVQQFHIAYVFYIRNRWPPEERKDVADITASGFLLKFFFDHFTDKHQFSIRHHNYKTLSGIWKTCRMKKLLLCVTLGWICKHFYCSRCTHKEIIFLKTYKLQ